MIESMVPSEICLQCDVCCRFPESDSPLAPYFTVEEVKGLLPADRQRVQFARGQSGKIGLVRFPDRFESPGHQGGCVCPFFDPLSHHCSIYNVRPFDCQIYPFALMTDGTNIFAGIDGKCPFVQDPANHPAIERHSKLFIEMMESAPFREMIRKNPGLIGPLQDDVTVLRKL